MIKSSILLSIILFMILFIAIGCSSDEETKYLEGVTGEIVEIDDESFLIQDNHGKVDLGLDRQ